MFSDLRICMTGQSECPPDQMELELLEHRSVRTGPGGGPGERECALEGAVAHQHLHTLCSLHGRRTRIGRKDEGFFLELLLSLRKEEQTNGLGELDPEREDIFQLSYGGL